MNDVERWIRHEGPEPEGIEELLEAARRDRRLTPQRSARMKRNIDAALAARRQRPSRGRQATWAVAAVLLAAVTALLVAVAGPAVVLAVRSTTGGSPLPTAPMVLATSEATTDGQAPTRPAADAGAPRAPATGAPRRPGK